MHSKCRGNGRGRLRGTAADAVPDGLHFGRDVLMGDNRIGRSDDGRFRPPAGCPAAGDARRAPGRPGADSLARIVAFDLDGTLVDGQSGSLVLRYLLSHGYVSNRALLRSAWWGIRYKLHLPHRQAEVREAIFRELKSRSTSEVTQIMRRFHQEVMVPRYRAQGLAEVARFREEGAHTVIVSATFDSIAQASREFVGAEVALATVMEVGPDGRYTGRVKGEVTAGAEKLRRVRAYADGRFGAGNWVLTDAFGDHYTDGPLLESAQRGHAVNPSPTLRRQAPLHGWEVLAWR